MIGSENNKIKISDLRKRLDRNGREYFMGSFGLARLFIFPNRHKKIAGDVDAFLYVCKKYEVDDIEERPAKPDKQPLTQSFREKMILKNENGGINGNKNQKN